MKKITVSILTTLLMLSMVFSSSVFAAEKEVSAWDSFLGLFSAKTAATTDVGVEYRGHIQNVGNYPLDGTWIQGPTQLGTVGQSLRLEGFWIRLTNQPADVNIEYEVHVQNVGWMAPVDNGDFAGTEGKSQQIEAIKIRLVKDNGEAVTDYSVNYRGHVQNIGDTAWYTNGQQLGTDGQFLRLEALEVEIVKNPADMTAYDAAVANAGALTQADYTAASWAALQTALTNNVVTEDNTQAEVDAATAAITAATDALVMVPRVVSVTTPSAGEIVVTFNKAMDATTLLVDPDTDKTVIAGLFLLNGANTLDGDNAVLSADAKTLTIYPAVALDGAYTFRLVKDKVTDTTDQYVGQYDTTLTVDDTTRPTITGVTTVSKYVFDVAVSEPVAATASYSASYTSDSAAVTVTGITRVDNNTTLRVTLNGATTANKEVSLVISDLTDLNGNVAVPQTVKMTVSDADQTKPTVVSAAATAPTEVTLMMSEGIDGTTVAAGDFTFNSTIGAVVSNAVVDTDDNTKIVVTLGTAQTAVGTIGIVANGFTDLSGNTIDAWSQLVNFKVDTTEPTINSNKVVTIGTDNYLELQMSEKVTIASVANLVFKYTDDYGVEQSVTVPNANVALDATDKTVVRVKLADAGATALSTGEVYEVEFVKGFFKDLFNNDSVAKTISFTNSGSATSTTKLSLIALNPVTVTTTVADGEYVVVKFEQPVNIADATNTANYVVEGTTVSSAKIVANSTAGATVNVYLTNNTITTTGSYNVTVSGIKGYESNVTTMDSVTTSLVITENVQPTIESKAITFSGGNTLVAVTYSENMFEAAANGDYTLYIDGVEQTSVTITNGIVNDVVTFTIDTDLSANIADGDVCKLVATDAFDLADTNDNVAVSDDITLN